MTTLVEFMIIASADNRPSMLEKSLYDSWKNCMELYIENQDNKRMILNSLQNGLLVWPTIKENGTTRTKKYEELSVAEKLQADYDLKATNIVLQSLPLDVYAIINHHKVAKDIWDRVKLLMQGTKLSLQEKKCKLYDEFDKFSFVKGEILYQYYWRFAQLINNMNVINMSMRPVQVNVKFLNSLPPEWSKFVTDVKLARDFHTTNYDQLYSYLEQHERHANETHLMHERYQDPLAFVGLVVPVFNQGDDLIVCLNKAMAFLIVVASSRQGEGNMARQFTQPKRTRNVTWFKEKAMLAEAQEAVQILDEEQLAFLADPGILNGQTAQTTIPNTAAFQTEDLDAYDSDCDDVSNEKAVLMANLSNCGSDDFEQTPVVDFSNNEIHSDSNIIPYSQYLQETQQATVQDINVYAQQDSMILSIIEQMSEQMINHVNNWEKANQEKNNESLTVELERYKERVKTFEHR
ncbi:hypothetical protein Tco_1268344 [Tanacetum coccineum]